MIGRDHAAQDFHQRGFAGAILPDQADDLAWRDRERHAGECHHARIGLADIGKFQKGLAHRRSHSVNITAGCL